MQNNTFFNDSGPNNIIVIDQVASTNDYLKNLLTKVKPLAPYTVIMAKNQTAGKGQRGNSWSSAPGLNLTASFLLTPKLLPISKQFLLTIVSSLSVYDAIEQYVTTGISIKWPNDILIKNKKIAGILIENKIAQQQIKQSIVGIGINVLQTEFPNDIKNKTTSLTLETRDKNLQIMQLAYSIQQNLKKYLPVLEVQPQDLINSYNEKLYNRGISSLYEYQGQEIIGKIIQVDIDGLLQIEINGNLKKIDLKGIAYKL